MIKADIIVGKFKDTAAGKVRNWWKADWTAMRADLDVADWDELEGLTASEAWQVFKDKVEKVVDDHVPLKPRGVSGRPPWMNRNILREVRKKRRLWKRLRDDKSDEYRSQEKKVKNLIRNAKRQMERKLALENGDNSKPFFEFLKSKLKS
jgi:hypothetical protein